MYDHTHAQGCPNNVPVASKCTSQKGSQCPSGSVFGRYRPLTTLTTMRAWWGDGNGGCHVAGGLCPSFLPCIYKNDCRYVCVCVCFVAQKCYTLRGFSPDMDPFILCYIYIYIYIYIYYILYTYTHTHTHIYKLYIYIYIYMCVYIQTISYICINTYLASPYWKRLGSLRTPLFPRTLTYKNYVYMYIYIYIHTYM
jgi:hypothetical protein